MIIDETSALVAVTNLTSVDEDLGRVVVAEVSAQKLARAGVVIDRVALEQGLTEAMYRVVVYLKPKVTE